MPSTYSPSLKIELIGNGEQSGTWGQTTNNNMGTLIEQAIVGVQPITLYGDYVLTNYNGLPDEARNAVLTFSGSLSAPANVVAPSVQKTYIITNNSGANVVVKTASGNGVTIQNGLSSLIYCDGADFYTAVNVNNVIGDLTVSGNETVGGSLTLGGNITLANTVTAGNLAMTANSGIITMAGNTGAFLPPTGSTAQRPGSPTVGMSRWNTDLGVYEIWNGISWQIIAAGTYTISYLAVAGGGGGGNSGFGGTIYGGGGGAGGYLSGTATLSPGTTYTITIGAGGGSQAQGANTSISNTATAIGGGYGSNSSGGSGGSGGGNNGAGTTGQGNAGGAGVSGADGGGGGASTVGGDASGYSSGGSGTSYGGNGGTGTASTITGSSVYYAGGGGGGKSIFAGPGGAGSGGTGGGGSGSASAGGSSGSANTGGGGGGAGWNGADSYGGSGGSGVCILSIPTASYTGITSGSPTVTAIGSNTILQYNSSGTYKA